MSDDYKALKLEFFEKFKQVEAAMKAAEHVGAEFPVPVVNELRYAGYHHIKADKEFLDGHEKEAIEEIRKSINHATRALFDVLEFHLAIFSQRAEATFAEFKGHENLAFEYIDHYTEHSKNIKEIGILADNAKFFDKESPEYQTMCTERIEKLQAFLSDFEAGKEALFSAITKERNSTWHKWGSAIIGAVIGALVAYLLQKLLG